jgi:excisionase family DNA binding protein
MTTTDVANRYDVPTRIVLRMIREGRLKAMKLGWQWVILESDLPETWPPPIRRAS